MQLGKALVGAVIGSAIGVGLILAIYYAIALDHTALAILVAVCAGLGVRALVTTTAHVSYLRGVLTCVVAILAFAGSKFLIADLAARGAFAKPMKPVAARPADDATDEKAAGDSGPAQPVETPQPVVMQPSGAAGATTCAGGILDLGLCAAERRGAGRLRARAREWGVERGSADRRAAGRGVEDALHRAVVHQRKTVRKN